MFLNALEHRHFFSAVLELTCRLTVSLYKAETRFEKASNSSVSFGQTTFTFCLSRHHFLLVLANDLVRGWHTWPLAHRTKKWRVQQYKKICLSWTTERDFIQASRDHIILYKNSPGKERYSNSVFIVCIAISLFLHHCNFTHDLLLKPQNVRQNTPRLIQTPNFSCT